MSISKVRGVENTFLISINVFGQMSQKNNGFRREFGMLSDLILITGNGFEQYSLEYIAMRIKIEMFAQKG